MFDQDKFKTSFDQLINAAPNSSTIEIQLSLLELGKLTEIITSFLNPGDWLFLDGDLGTGKTAFTKELSIPLGANEFSTSPTFSILNTEKLNPLKGISEKNSKIINFIHLDLYRLKNGKELIFLGLENEFNLNNSVCVFEWPYNVDEDDFENLFKITKCPRPKRIFEISIEINSQNPDRTYSFKRIL